MKKWKKFATWLFCILLCVSAISVHAQQKEESSVKDRLTKAKELGLSEWVDEEGYLVDEFYEGRTDSELSELGIDELIRTLDYDELEIYVSNLRDGVGVYTVTRYEKVSQVNPSTGNYLYTGIFEVDGVLAFCIERSVATPPKGSVTGEPELVTNDNIRKVLYYGYNGPADCGYTYVETALAAGEANGDGDNALGRAIFAEIKQKSSPPANFKVWKVETNYGQTQDLVYYTMERNGYGQVQKISANTAITSGNNCYALEGAVFGIYSNAGCTSELGRVSTAANGLSGSISLPAGTYYVKEIKSPKGYLLDSQIKSMTINASATTTVTMADAPQTITTDKIIQKKDAQTGQAIPQGTGTLSGAKFSVKFYKGNYAEGVNPAKSGVVPSKQWIFSTDEDGLVRFRKEYLVSGDGFWTDNNGKNILPLGTLTIEEIFSSDGYRINPTVYVKKIDANTTTLQPVEVSEEIVELELYKYREDTTQPLSGAIFEHVSPNGTAQQLVTDEDGKFICKGLLRGVHQIREVSAPIGYPENLNVISFVVDENNQITVTSKPKEEYGAIRTILTDKGNLRIEVEDKLGFRLPETGCFGGGAWGCLGMCLCMGGLQMGIRKRRKEEVHFEKNV